MLTLLQALTLEEAGLIVGTFLTLSAIAWVCSMLARVILNR